MPNARAVALAAVTTRPRRASRECKMIGPVVVGFVFGSACDFAAATRWLGQLGSQMQSTRMLMMSPLR